jgi:hypothetical protein
MTLLPPRPRFHVVLWSQLIGAVMVLSGILPYWFKLDRAWLPESIYHRTVTATAILFVMFAAPLVINFWDSVLGGFHANPQEHPERIANNPKWVRIIIWGYCLIDLLLLTYLVHITGGLIGSMYAGLYLLIPALALLLMLSSADLRHVPWLITLAIIGIAFAYWMCGTPERVEYDASQHHHAFNLAVALVSWEGAILLFIQVAILKRQMAD